MAKRKTAKPKTKLTDRQRVFAAVYAKTLNKSQAAREAGYDAKKGNEVYRLPHVRAHIRQLIEDKVNAIGVEADDVLREIARIALSSPTEVVTVEEDMETVVIGGGDDDEGEDARHLDVMTKKVRILETDLWSTSARAAVSEISQGVKGDVKVRFHNKVEALKLLAEYFKIIKGEGASQFDGANVFIVPSKEESIDAWQTTAQQVQRESKKKAEIRLGNG